ncbi:putative reverse transcriptase domain-containing protein [Tanacetum coccineum]
MPLRNAPKTRTTRSSPATTTTTTTPMTDEQLKTLTGQGVADMLEERYATRSINGEDNHDSSTGIRRQAPLAREFTYPNFMKCKTLYFKGTKGVVKLTQWFERLETVFRISNCTVENQIKFATCTFLGSALTWWNSHELALMYARMFPEESDKIERSTLLLNVRVKTKGSKMITNNNRTSGRTLARLTLLRLCAPKCHKCNRVGHLAHDYRSTPNANTANNQRGTRAGQKATCFECRAQGHFRKECLKRKNNNQGNPAGNGNAPAKVYAGNETLIVRGDGSDQGNETHLNIIPCIKTQKYMLKGCHVFLAHVTTKETKDKLEEKRLEDVPIVQDFPKVTCTLLIGLVQNERIVRPTERAFRQRLYKAQFLTLESFGLVCQEEGWIISNVHRLPKTEQANSEESLSTPKDR